MRESDMGKIIPISSIQKDFLYKKHQPPKKKRGRNKMNKDDWQFEEILKENRRQILMRKKAVDRFLKENGI